MIAPCQLLKLKRKVHMLEIKITDPHLMDKEFLRKTATYLFSLAGDEVVSENQIRPELNLGDRVDVLADAISKANEPVYEHSHVDLDVNGLPWDFRIHASTRTKNADGSWKNKRGVSQHLSVEVKDELKRTMAIEVPVPPVPNPTVETETPIDFMTVMGKITCAVQEKKINHAQIFEIVRSFGLESVPLIAQRPDLLPAISQKIDEFLQNQ